MERFQLTNKNFVLFAARHYDNPHCRDEDEFKSDLNYFKYIKRLMRKYQRTGDMDARSVRLVLNHIITLINLFGVQPAAHMLFFKLEPDLHPILKPFLLKLHSLPNIANGINTQDVVLDATIVRYLRNI